MLLCHPYNCGYRIHTYQTTLLTVRDEHPKTDRTGVAAAHTHIRTLGVGSQPFVDTKGQGTSAESVA